MVVVIIKGVLMNVPNNKYEPYIISMAPGHVHIVIWTL